MKQSPTLVPALLAVVTLLLLAPVALFAQGDSSAKRAADLFVGKYKGAVNATGGPFDVSLEIKSENTKLSGSVVTPKGEQTFPPTELTDGKLKIKLGSVNAPETLLLQVRDGKRVSGALTDPSLILSLPSVSSVGGKVYSPLGVTTLPESLVFSDLISRLKSKLPPVVFTAPLYFPTNRSAARFADESPCANNATGAN